MIADRKRAGTIEESTKGWDRGDGRERDSAMRAGDGSVIDTVPAPLLCEWTLKVIWGSEADGSLLLSEVSLTRICGIQSETGGCHPPSEWWSLVPVLVSGFAECNEESRGSFSHLLTETSDSLVFITLDFPLYVLISPSVVHLTCEDKKSGV